MMRRKILAISFIIIIFFTCATLLFNNRLQRVEEYRGLKVGDSSSAFYLAKNYYEEIGVFEQARFFVFFISDTLDNINNWKLNDQLYYDYAADMISEKKGKLWSYAGGKVGELFGINRISKNNYKLDGSLIAIINSDGKILALYEKAKLRHIKRAVDGLVL
ncbi:hypothetical protein ACFL52_00280 [Candidatus Margulisiibacteriota bacterium]